MQFDLVPHPSTPPGTPPFRIWATVDHAASFGATATANVWFGVSAPIQRFQLPPASQSTRSDGLWHRTCFELFLKEEGQEPYKEWNFSPSTEWAAYQFTGYREGMAEATVANPPYVRMEDNFTWWALGATIALPAGPRWRLGLSAVIEEADGTKSYWALAHGTDKPDFHHPDCFAARLA